MSAPYGTTKVLRSAEAVGAIRNPDLTKISTTAPENPKSSEWYMFRTTNDRSHPFWRSDGRTWRAKNKKHDTVDGEEFTRSYFYLVCDGKNKNPFRRVEIYRAGSEIGRYEFQPNTFVVCWYDGTLDIATVKNKPHGNAKDSPLKVSARVAKDLASQGSPSRPSVAFTSANNDTPERLPRAPVTTPTSGAYFTTGRSARSNSSDNEADNAYHARQLQQLHENSSSAKRSLADAFDCVSSGAEEEDHINTPPVSAATDEDVNEIPIDDIEEQSPRPFRKTPAKVTAILKDSIRRGSTPVQAYKSALLSSAVSPNLSDLQPRNRRQAQYAAASVAKEIEHDEIYSLYATSFCIPNYFYEIKIGPALTIIFGHAEMIRHFNSLRGEIPQLEVNVDTKYNEGLFYLTVLSFRHTMLKTKPVLPCLFMIHQRVNQRAHNDFFREAVDLMPQLNKETTVIVSDRERAITNAIHDFLPNSIKFICWFHIKKNVIAWALDKYGREKASALAGEVMNLMFLDRPEAFEVCKQAYADKWPVDFLAYFNRHLHVDIFGSSRWMLEERGLFEHGSGITNNASESVNAVISRLKTDGTMTGLANALYFLQVHHLADLQRVLKENEGEWELLPPYKNRTLKVAMPENISDVVDVAAISTMLTEGCMPENLRVIKSRKLPPSRLMTTDAGIGDFIFKKNRVKHVSEFGVFVVEGLAKKTYLVDIAANTCTCIAQGQCPHLIAVQKSTNLFGKKKCKPRPPTGITRIYKATAARKTGKKGPARIRLPAGARGPGVHVPVVDPEEASELDSPSKDSFPLLPDTPRTLDLMPEITSTNYSLEILRIGDHSLTMVDLKSLQESLTRKEIVAMKKDSTRFKKSEQGWVTNNIIAAFLYEISDHEKSVIIGPDQAKQILLGKDKPSVLKFKNDDQRSFVDSLEKLVLLFHSDGNHWIVLGVGFSTKIVDVMDPASTFRMTEDQVGRLFTALDTTFPGRNDAVTWKVRYPQKMASQDGVNCGVFVCSYGARFLNDNDILEEIEPKLYREVIFRTLMKNCPITLNTKVCARCKKKVIKKAGPVNWTGCDRCNAWWHNECAGFDGDQSTSGEKFTCIGTSIN